MNDPNSRRSTYRSPDAVIAEAHRIAADIRRRAEREANAVRRDAAEWASTTRREAERHREEAERYRQRILAELEHVRAAEAEPPAPEPEVEPTPRPVRDARGSVIDLRSAAEARGTPMSDDHDHDDDDEVDEEVEEAYEELAPRPAVGGTYVVGHRPVPVETSIETKVHDVVRLAVRRTFHRRFP